jgi:formate hydrogenlyase subunit 3/multisubunit Na+/H+ antiporter MnhD subunit
MSNELDELMVQIINQVKNTGDFVVEQMPDVVQQLLTYQYYSTVFYLIVGIVFLMVSFFSFYKVRELDKKSVGNPDVIPYIIAFLMIGIMSGLVGIVNVCENIDPLLKLTFAPKIYLIEYASRLIK